MYGDSLRDFVVGFIVVEPAFGKKYAESKGVEFNDELMANEEFKIEVLKDLYVYASENDFNSLEKPKQVFLTKDPWTDADLLTPTMKMKRNIAKTHYAEQIDAMYNAGPIKIPK